MKDFTCSKRFFKLMKRFNVPKKYWKKAHKLYKDINLDIDRWTYPTEYLKELFAQQLKIKLPEQPTMLEEFINLFRPNIPMHALAKLTACKTPVGLLTNMHIDMLSMLKQKKLIPNIRWKTVVDSSKLGTAKPEKKIFEIAIKRAKLPASEILFVDNKQENIEVAQELGMQTYLYDSCHYNKSAKDFYRRGVANKLF